MLATARILARDIKRHATLASAYFYSSSNGL